MKHPVPPHFIPMFPRYVSENSDPGMYIFCSSSHHPSLTKVKFPFNCFTHHCKHSRQTLRYFISSFVLCTSFLMLGSFSQFFYFSLSLHTVDYFCFFSFLFFLSSHTSVSLPLQFLYHTLSWKFGMFLGWYPMHPSLFQWPEEVSFFFLATNKQ